MSGIVVRTYHQDAGTWRCACGVGGNWLGPGIEHSEAGVLAICPGCGARHARLYPPRRFARLRAMVRRMLGKAEGRRLKAEG